MENELKGVISMGGKRLCKDCKSKKKGQSCPKKMEWSKVVTIVVLATGIIALQECFILMAACIVTGFTSTAAYLTAAVTTSEAVIAFALKWYLAYSGKVNTAGGITYDAAKAKNFVEDFNSPSL